jgi:hypothetical protein
MVGVVESMDRLVFGYQCKRPVGRGASKGWRLGLRERGEGDGARREERETLGREKGEG